MSYILDALRKADAQRERDPARGIHAQPVLAASQSPDGRRTPPWAIAAAGALLVLAAAGAWWLVGGHSGTQPLPAASPAERTPSAAVTAPVSPTLGTAAAPTVAPAVAAVVPPAAPAAAIDPAPAPARPAPAAIPAIRPPPAAAAPVRPAASVATTQPADAPRLAISGGVYSTSPAQRMLIVGGQVFNEGSEVAPGVVLEQVRPNQALLNFQGQRYTVRY